MLKDNPLPTTSLSIEQKKTQQNKLQMQSEILRVPLAEDEHSRKEILSGEAAFGRRATQNLILPWSSCAFPLHF